MKMRWLMNWGAPKATRKTSRAWFPNSRFGQIGFIGMCRRPSAAKF
jgi:hypothetical protein